MKKLISILLIFLNLTFLICPASALNNIVAGSRFQRDNLSLADEYRLAPGDKLEVRIINRKELDTSQALAPDGTISLPLLGRVTVSPAKGGASGQTLSAFNKKLTSDFGKYIERPQVVVYLTPRPIYVIQHDVRRNTWEVKEANSVEEARALAGKEYKGEIKAGNIVAVEIGKKPDFFEDNWYKIITAGAVIVGIYTTLNR
ncbi:MAG: polysaccharide biosynthesis/export family protein [Candidatus Margulisbacteria bacterium]|nr:polysaccharide biosynthesis/export family protein [Candidatus Margulisiibacteriota bacterium]